MTQIRTKKLTEIVTSELQKDIERMFGLYDIDGNGNLDRVEIRSLINESRASIYLPKLDQTQFLQIMKVLDINNDKQVSLSELQENFDKLHEKICEMGNHGRKKITKWFAELNINENEMADRKQVHILFRKVGATINIKNFDKWISDFILDALLLKKDCKKLDIDDVVLNYRFILYVLKNPTDTRVVLSDQYQNYKENQSMESPSPDFRNKHQNFSNIVRKKTMTQEINKVSSFNRTSTAFIGSTESPKIDSGVFSNNSRRRDSFCPTMRNSFNPNLTNLNNSGELAYFRKFTRQETVAITDLVANNSKVLKKYETKAIKEFSLSDTEESLEELSKVKIPIHSTLSPKRTQVAIHNTQATKQTQAIDRIYENDDECRESMCDNTKSNKKSRITQNSTKYNPSKFNKNPKDLEISSNKDNSQKDSCNLDTKSSRDNTSPEKSKASNVHADNQGVTSQYANTATNFHLDTNKLDEVTKKKRQEFKKLNEKCINNNSNKTDSNSSVHAKENIFILKKKQNNHKNHSYRKIKHINAQKIKKDTDRKISNSYDTRNLLCTVNDNNIVENHDSKILSEQLNLQTDKQGTHNVLGKNSERLRNNSKIRNLSGVSSKMRMNESESIHIYAIKNKIESYSLNLMKTKSDEIYQKEVKLNTLDTFKKSNKIIDKSCFYEALKCCSGENWNTSFFDDLSMDSLQFLESSARELKRYYQREVEQILKFTKSLESFINTKIIEETVPRHKKCNNLFNDLPPEKVQSKRMWQDLYKFVTLDSTKKNSDCNFTFYNRQKTKEGQKINLNLNKDSENKNLLTIDYKNPIKLRNLEKDVFRRTTDNSISILSPNISYTVDKCNKLDISNFDNDSQNLNFKRRTQTAIRKGSSYRRKHYDISKYEQCNLLEDRNTVSEKKNDIKSKLNKTVRKNMC